MSGNKPLHSETKPRITSSENYRKQKTTYVCARDRAIEYLWIFKHFSEQSHVRCVQIVYFCLIVFLFLSNSQIRIQCIHLLFVFWIPFVFYSLFILVLCHIFWYIYLLYTFFLFFTPETERRREKNLNLVLENFPFEMRCVFYDVPSTVSGSTWMY